LQVNRFARRTDAGIAKRDRFAEGKNLAAFRADGLELASRDGGTGRLAGRGWRGRQASRRLVIRDPVGQSCVPYESVRSDFSRLKEIQQLLVGHWPDLLSVFSVVPVHSVGSMVLSCFVQGLTRTTLPDLEDDWQNKSFPFESFFP
jgi:hypothetical protein